MKIRILAVVAVLLMLLSVNVSAASYEYTVSLDSGFTSASYGDDLSEIAEKLDMTVDELNSYFSKNGLLYLAVSGDAKTQIRLSAFTDNFSSAVVDISHLDEDGLNEFKDAVSADNENAFYAESGESRKFIVVKNTLQDSGGVYTVTQYITICDSKTFYLSCYNEGEDTSAQIDAVFNSFSLNAVETLQNDSNSNLVYILIAAGILLFAIVAVIMIIGIIKAQRQK